MRSTMQQLSVAQHQIEQLATGIEPTILRLLSESEVRADQSMQFIESKSHTTLLNTQARLDQLNQRIISDMAQQLDRTTTHITQTYQSLLSNADHQIKQATQHVEALGNEILGVSPKATLQRGFAMIRSESGIPISSVHQAKLQTSLTIEFRDGSLIAKPTKTPKRKNHE
jgi:exodeoxyribonuclease VII large subunit